MKTGVLYVVIAALIMSNLFFIDKLYQKPKNFVASPNKDISKTDFIKYRKAYLEDAKCLTTTYFDSTLNIVVRDAKLEGLRLSVKDLSNVTKDPAKDVIFYLGKDIDDTYKNYTLIAIGVENDPNNKYGKLILPDVSVNDPLIQDKAVPCPPNCPSWPKK